MSSFIKCENPYKDIPLADFIMKKSKEHNTDMQRLEQLSGIDFITYKISSEVMISEIKDKYDYIDHWRVQTYIDMKMRNAYKKYIKYMMKYKGITHEEALKQLWSEDRPQTK